MVRVVDEVNVRRGCWRDKKLDGIVEEEVEREPEDACISRVTSRRRNNGRGAGADCVNDDATALRLTNLAELPIVAIASCGRGIKPSL